MLKAAQLSSGWSPHRCSECNSPQMESSPRQEFVDFMRRMELEPVHVIHVTNLALQLFDELAPLHGLGPYECLLLEAAGYLHDIGHASDDAALRHNEHSARLIREHRWKHFPQADVEIIAQVARYHRKALPDVTHSEFARLSPCNQKLVKMLAALLRVADALDRSHQQSIKGVRVQITRGRLVFHLDTAIPCTREVGSACRKGDLARLVFQRELVFMVGKEIVNPEPPPT